MYKEWNIEILILLMSYVLSSPFLFAQEVQSETDKSRQLLPEQMELKLQEQVTIMGENEEDLGEPILIRRKPKAWSITLNSDIGEFWSSNILLIEDDPQHHAQSGFALTQNDSLTVTYKITDELTFTGGYRFSMFKYHRLIAENFDAHSASGNLSYTLPYDITVWTGVQWTTVYSRPIGDSVYEEADGNIGISKVIPLNFASWMKDRAVWFVGYQSDLRLVSPKELDKVEISPYTGFYYLICPKLTLQTFYRWQYQHFQIYGRKDYNNSVTGNLVWSPYEWMSVSSFGGYTDNNSLGKGARNYNVFTAGVTIRFSWKF